MLNNARAGRGLTAHIAPRLWHDGGAALPGGNAFARGAGLASARAPGARRQRARTKKKKKEERKKERKKKKGEIVEEKMKK